MNILHPKESRVIVGCHLPVFHGKDRTMHRQRVDDVIRSEHDASDIFFLDLVGLNRRNRHIFMDDGHTLRSGKIDQTVLIFRDRTDGKGIQAVLLIEVLPLALVEDCHTIVIRTCPQAVLRVHKQADNTGDTGLCGVDTHKAVTIVLHQSAVASDPPETFRGLCDGICFRGRKSICIVIENRRIPGGGVCLLIRTVIRRIADRLHCAAGIFPGRNLRSAQNS